MFEVIQGGFSTYDKARQWLLKNEKIPLEDLPYISISQEADGSWAILENHDLFAGRRKRKENKMKIWIHYRDSKGKPHRDPFEQKGLEGIEFEIDANKKQHITIGIAYLDRLSVYSPIGSRLLVLPNNRNFLYLQTECE